jgi:hypothetical protein
MSSAAAPCDRRPGRARRTTTRVAVRSFCERRHVPALVTYKAKGVVPGHACVVRRSVHQTALSSGRLLARATLIIGARSRSGRAACRAPWPYSHSHAVVPAARGLWMRVTCRSRRRSSCRHFIRHSEHIERDLRPRPWRADVVCRHAAEQRSQGARARRRIYRAARPSEPRPLAAGRAQGRVPLTPARTCCRPRCSGPSTSRAGC